MKAPYCTLILTLGLLPLAWGGTPAEDWKMYWSAMNRKDYASAETLASGLFAREDFHHAGRLRAGELLAAALTAQKKDTTAAREQIVALATAAAEKETNAVARLPLINVRLNNQALLGKISEEDLAKSRRELVSMYAEVISGTTNSQRRARLLFAQIMHMTKLKESTVAEQEAILNIAEPVGDIALSVAGMKAARLKEAGQFAAAAQVIVDKVDQAENIHTMRAARNKLNTLAGTINRMILAKEGKSFVGPGKLALAQALVDAENSGRGLEDALAALGLKAPASWASQRTAIAAERDVVLAGTQNLNPVLATRIEWFLGIAGAKEFEQRYNQGSASVK